MSGAPGTPRSPLNLARTESFPSPLSQSGDGSVASAGSPSLLEDGYVHPSSKRRLSGIGRKMRSFLDLLSVRQ